MNTDEDAAPRDAERSALLAGVTHALRTPLTLVLGPLDDLLAGEYGPLPEEAAEALAGARRNARRLRALVDGLVDGAEPVAVTPVAVTPVEPFDAEGADSGYARVDSEDITTVLVVDDEPEIRAHVRRHLERAGYRVVEAADGRAGLAVARRVVPDLIVSDVMMPEMDGLALCRALKADPETDFIPVVLLTAKGARADRLDGLREHAEAYLVKPFDADELLVLVETRIAVRTRLRERFRREAPAPPVPAPPVEEVSTDDAFLTAVTAAVDAHLGDDRFTVERLAEAVGLSRVHLYRQLRDHAGQSPSELIWTRRLARAEVLLAAGAGTVSEIAYAVGFKNAGHFSDRFEAYAGCRPSAYAVQGR